MMKRSLKAWPFLAIFLLVTASVAHAQLGTSTGTTTVNVTVAAEAALNITNGTTNLTSTGTNFSNYTGSTSLTYFIRTTQSTGAGSLTLKVTADFSPSGGPSVGTPPTAGDALSYTCNVAANAATVSWTLTNDPKYKTGSYSATVTFTISAT